MMDSRVTVKPKWPSRVSTSGSVALRIRKPASFKGCHNENRALVLLVLDGYYSQHHGHGKGLSVRELSLATGRPLDSLQATIGRWAKWKFISRHRARDSYGRRIVYHYRILKRGRKWLQRHLSVMPLERYQADLQCRS